MSQTCENIVINIPTRPKIFLSHIGYLSHMEQHHIKNNY